MPRGIWGNRGKKCFNCGGRPFSRINRQGAMYCSICYRRIKKYGYFKRCIKDVNQIIQKGDLIYIKLYDKNGTESGTTKTNKKFLNTIKKYKFGKDGRGYVHTKISGKAIKLHQIIIGKKDGFVIDHINGDVLDNRMENLRHVTNAQNTWNKKSAKGYYFEKRRSKYVVRIKRNGITYGGKGFRTEEEAREESKRLRMKYFGVYAKDYIK